MTCAEFQELAACMALGALSPDERAEAEAHLAEPSHTGCFEALRRASDGVEVLARSLVPARPDDRVWSAIEAGLAAPGPARPAAPRWRERVAFGAAAAAALLLLANLSARSRDNRRFAEQAARYEAERQASSARAGKELEAASSQREACAKELSALRGEAALQRSALALLQSPSTLLVSLAPPQGGQPGARALINLQDRKGVLLSAALAPQAGKDYELWLIRGDRKLPAGLLRAGPSGEVLAAIDPQLFAGERPDAVAVTLEAEGGAPQPQGPIVLVGALPKA